MFRAVPPEEILSVWPTIEPGIRKIKERCGAQWHESQIKARLLNNQASLFVRPDGFVILEKCHEPITGEPYLNVWMMFSRPTAFRPIKEEIVQWLYAMRDKACCAWWQFGSPREEWAEVIKPYCNKVMTIWRSK